MNILKTFAAASAIALASFTVSAAPITSGGVMWDPDHDEQPLGGADFFATSNYVQSYLDSVTGNSISKNDLTDGDIAQGFGKITSLNDKGTDYYCANRCTNLLFAYTDFVYDSVSEEFTGGTLSFYVNHSGTENVADFTAATSGDLWLELERSVVDVAELPDTEYTDGVSILFDVVETLGTVWSNFDTNTLAGADVGFAATTQALFTGTGTGNFVGDSIPEPTTLAIFGLGLLGLARMRKAK